MFSYYGPMHDGVVWELQLIPKNAPLPRSWLLLDKPKGDRISEALQQGHTLEEAIELSEAICENWQKGLNLLPKEATGELATLSEALGVLFDSGKNILKFYALREKLGLRQGDPVLVLNEMRGIVEAEMENSERMIELCEADPRLGYHSEAEGFKFFPAKLSYRIETLETLLETEFKEVEERIDAGKAPLGFYEAEGESCYPLGRDLSAAKTEAVGTSGSFKAAYDAENVYLDIECEADAEVVFCFEGKLLTPACEIIIKDAKPYLDLNTGLYSPLWGERFEKEYSNYKIERTDKGYRVAASREHIGWTEDERPFRLCLKINGDSWIKEENPVYTLGKDLYSAGEFGVLR